MTPETSLAERPAPTAASHQRPVPREWYRSAAIYQIYPRSFADGDGNGVGDLPGITSRLDDLRDLGIDAIWLSPFMTSPQKDAGYDVSDYCDVDPLFGTLADFDVMLAEAHARGLRVIVDLVPNHSSDQHVWFQAALNAAPGSVERGRYMFRDGKGENGELPPNNWESVFGGPAWTRITEADGRPGQWYLHLFDSSQPDFDWANPEVRAEFHRILRFWLDRGVDGFRVDVAHGLVKHNELPDYVPPVDAASMGGAEPVPYWGQEGVHEVYREWRKLLEEYDGDRALCAEAWMPSTQEIAKWVRSDEMHQAFNFSFMYTEWDASALRSIIDESFAAFGGVGAPSTWVLSNHDVVRHASRLALGADSPQGHGVGPLSPGKPDPVLGLRRARAYTTLMLALPGSAYLYQGEELGLPEAIELPDEARQDPTWFRTNGERYGRDGCRVPLPWEAGAPAFGFSETGKAWLPQPSDWDAYARDVQAQDPESTLNLYKTLLRLRRELHLGSEEFAWADDVDVPETAVAFRSGRLLVIANPGAQPVALPSDARVLVASGPLAEDVDGDKMLPTDTAVWLLQG
ncbi:glycoside hydrolase family 13 protein [Microbacterium stercoris]|uniref:Glycoside hydrolase family 13 protein n=1 Tax=Microbacterium stercoris TaxID=2820289 RepID=A0A939QHU2_9MICO|nr:alpha-amylase family glycosyl hydrolase [Microbacterium stercoris]MBO3663108.1 glycoside hydrolase family 13 protein [Microbacterium stercoris]